MNFKKIFVALLLLLSAVSCPLIKAQAVASGMTGTVTDKSGAAVAGVTVTLTNKATGTKYTQVTNASGLYRFSDIPPGQGYEAVFTSSGFAPFSVKSIYLTVATTRTQDVTLSAGANQEVEVTASNSEVTINTTDATIANKIVVYEFVPEAGLDLVNGFNHITVQTGASNAANITRASAHLAQRIRGASAPTSYV